MSDIQLLPCPFCGGAPSFESLVTESMIRCQSCGARVDANVHPCVYTTHDAMKRAEDKRVVELWNARHEAQDRRIAELEWEVSSYQGLLDAAIDDYNNARNTALEEAAKLLDAEAARLDANWNEYRLSGAQGPATSLARIPATYAAAIRSLITKEG